MATACRATSRRCPRAINLSPDPAWIRFVLSGTVDHPSPRFEPLTSQGVARAEAAPGAVLTGSDKRGSAAAGMLIVLAPAARRGPVSSPGGR